MADLDLNAAITTSIAVYNNEILQLNERIKYLIRLAKNVPSVKSFAEEWGKCEAMIKVIAVPLCNAVDNTNKDGRYDEIIVEKEFGTNDYEWFIVLRQTDVVRKIRIPEYVSGIPHKYSPETEHFIRHLHTIKKVSYSVRSEEIDLSFKYMTQNKSEPLDFRRSQQQL